MPSIELKIRQRQEEINQNLENLPELPSREVFMTVVQHLSVFTSDVQKILEGGSTHNAFHSHFSKICDQFRETVLDMKPSVTISHPSDKVDEIISIDSDDDDTETRMSSPSYMNGFGTGNSRKRFNADPMTPTPIKRPNFGPSQGAGSPSGGLRQVSVKKEFGGVPLRLATPVPNAPQSPDLNPFSDILKHHKDRSLNKTNTSLALIRRKIEEHTKAGLPGVVSPQVYTDLCLNSVQPWDKPCARLLVLTINMLRENADAALLNVFQKWSQTQLYKLSRELLAKFFDKLQETQKEALEALCDLEANNDFTVNKLALATYKMSEGNGIRKMRREHRAKMKVINDGRRFKTDEQRKAAEKDAVEKGDLGPDPFEPELEVASYVRGYYKTAALRFVDSTCLSIHGKLFSDVRKKIPHYLENELQVYTGGK
jgi:hypothetical protein